MIFTIAAALTAALLQPAPKPAQPETPPDLGQLIGQAAADASIKRDNGKLKALCQVKVDRAFVTFVSAGDDKVLLAALSSVPLVDPRKAISLEPIVTFEGKAIGGEQESGTADWAYVYDQNGDGRIDLFSFLIGPYYTEPEVPVPDPPANVHHQRGQMYGPFPPGMILPPFAFWHAVDEDGDGRLDWTAYPAEKKSNSWYRGWGVISVKDGSCRILNRDGSFLERCAPTADEKDYESASRYVSRVWETMPSEVFAWFSKGAQACKLPASAFRRLPSTKN